MTLNSWLAHDEAIDEGTRAVLAQRRIDRDPESIVFLRNGAKLPAQSLRLELINTARDESSETVTVGVMRSVLFGIRNHPTLSDTDIQRGDRFTFHNTSYEVSVVAYLPGEVQAHCAVRSA